MTDGSSGEHLVGRGDDAPDRHENDGPVAVAPDDHIPISVGIDISGGGDRTAELPDGVGERYGR